MESLQHLCPDCGSVGLRDNVFHTCYREYCFALCFVVRTDHDARNKVLLNTLIQEHSTAISLQSCNFVYEHVTRSGESVSVSVLCHTPGKNTREACMTCIEGHTYTHSLMYKM